MISICRHDKTLRTLPRNYLVTETRSSFYVPIDGNAVALEQKDQQFGVDLKVYVVVDSCYVDLYPICYFK